IVVTDFRPTAETCVWQARAGVPSRWMVHAPHSPIPHPYFVPTRPKASRSTHNIGVSDATSTEWVRPLTFRVYLLMVHAGQKVESPARGLNTRRSVEADDVYGALSVVISASTNCGRLCPAGLGSPANPHECRAADRRAWPEAPATCTPPVPLPPSRRSPRGDWRCRRPRVHKACRRQYSTSTGRRGTSRVHLHSTRARTR